MSARKKPTAAKSSQPEEKAGSRVWAESSGSADEDEWHKCVNVGYKAGLQELVKPHLESFNYFLAKGGGLESAVSLLQPQMLDANPDAGTPSMRFWIEEALITPPTKEGDADATDVRLFPNECREMSTTYGAPFSVKVCWQAGDEPPQSYVKKLGNLPVMVKSSMCHLANLSPSELMERREERNELGGYFIMNGNERLIRLLIVPRRNHVFGIIRPSFNSRGRSYTPFACQMRCVRADQSSQTITLHYLSSGACTVRVSIKKQEFFIPAVLVLKALTGASDRQIYEAILRGNHADAFAADRAELMLRDAKKLGLVTRTQVLSYLGSHFKVVLRPDRNLTDEQVGLYLLEHYLFIHCADNKSKFDALVFMIRKLYALAQGTIQPDNPDALNSQEVLLPGHLYSMMIKEKLQDFVVGIKNTVLKDLRINPQKVQPGNVAYMRKVIDSQGDVCRKIEYFLLTGNLVSGTGLDLMQTSGFTVVADKLNFFRYIAHFRSIHRGQFFTTMKTTTVRKLLPEAWGFVCPVHTPDGGPCGLLNHLAAMCQIQTHPWRYSVPDLIKVLVELGMTPSSHPVTLPHDYINILLDGIVVGSVAPSIAPTLTYQLRLLKVQRHPSVPPVLEMLSIFNFEDGVFPGIYLSTNAARMLRPVKYLATAKNPEYIELIGPMEQVFMEIACTPEDFREGETTHAELTPTSMLSLLASLTPFSDFNQSPRNMYQCQMGKQTMGTPLHSFPHRIDNKLYRIQNPQTPLVRNQNYDRYSMDEYPLGANAVVAVISYTGYDMEDAMILCKSSYERGFGHASVYKHVKVDCRDMNKGKDGPKYIFANPVNPDAKKPGERSCRTLDPNGLPSIGQYLQQGDPLYCLLNTMTNKVKIVKHKESEPCYIDSVRVLNDAQRESRILRVGITLRFNRNPVIGDKFSSRHGQKGVLSVLWPQENMPFTESGMVPDVIINPHAFPSRMTIGMLVESLAGKAGACHGRSQDGTPFRYNEQHTAVRYFGEQLVKAGYNYAGSEPLYSGLFGTELMAEIYIGVVYYQRLRHMVSDKSQVRATGPINQITHQPVQGRKVHGGIRFGEMERDSLLAHGVAFMLHDRLMNCSDYHEAPVCRQCGSLLSPYFNTPNSAPEASSSSMMDSSDARAVKHTAGRLECRICRKPNTCVQIAVPYIFIYLANELAAMNIRISLTVK